MARLLLVAPACDGEDVGEAWLAFQWVRRLAERHETTVLTYHKRGHTPLSRQLSGLRVVEWTEPPFLGRAERLNSMLKPAYLPFYVRARRWTQAAIRRGEMFDVAHQPVPVALRYPSPVAGLGVPLVVGPVGGSLDSPPGFAGDADSAPWYVGLRSFDQFRLRHDRLLRSTYERAACVIGIAPYVGEMMSGLRLRRFEVMSDTGLEQLPPAVDRSGHTGPVRLLHVGRLVRTKGARDVIRAVSQLPHLQVVLDVVGDGFDRQYCEGLVAELGLRERVFLHGALPRADIDAFYRRADVFTFPSYREPGGIVVSEAMGFGLPLVVADRGGPASAVDDTCAIRLPVDSPEQLARDCAGAISRLVTDSALRERMGQGARDRAEATALWSRKIERIEELYECVQRPSP